MYKQCLPFFIRYLTGKTWVPHLRISRYDTGHVTACTGSDESHHRWVIPWNKLFSLQLHIIIFLVTKFTDSSRPLHWHDWWCIYSLHHVHKADILSYKGIGHYICLLRDRSLHDNFQKKNVVSVHAPELPFCIALNHLTRTLNTRHRTATTIYLLQHWSDRGYVGNLNPKQA